MNLIKYIIFSFFISKFSAVYASDFSVEKYQHELVMVSGDFAKFLSYERKKNNLRENNKYIYQYDIISDFESEKNIIIYRFIPHTVLKENVVFLGGGATYWFDFNNEVIFKRLLHK